MRTQPAILLVDDDTDALLLMRKAFEKAKVTNPVETVSNGQQAMEYLSGSGAYATQEKFPWPSLMLLDLKMPAPDGFEVLAWWQTQTERREFPIVVMSLSKLPEDIQRAFTLGAASYFTKPADFNNLIEIAGQLWDRWLKPIELPHADG